MRPRVATARIHEAELAKVCGAATTPRAIEVNGVSKLYEPQPAWMRIFSRTPIRAAVLALQDVSFNLDFGNILAVVGPNGAGKTTIFRIIVGLTTPTRGTVTVAGLDVTRDIDEVRQAVGWMSAEERSLLMRATCRENLHLHGRLQGLRPPRLHRRIDEVLALVGLEAQRDTIVAGLSAGMKARLRLARALLPSPQVLLLDEPTGALDPVAAHRFLSLIMELVEVDRLAVMISSHRLEEIEALRSNAILMDRGRVRFSGSLETLRELVELPTVEIVFCDPESARQAADLVRPMCRDVEWEGPVLRAVLEQRDGIGELLVVLGPLAAAVRRFHERPTPLRDVIASVYEVSDDERVRF